MITTHYTAPAPILSDFRLVGELLPYRNLPPEQIVVHCRKCLDEMHAMRVGLAEVRRRLPDRTIDGDTLEVKREA